MIRERGKGRLEHSGRQVRAVAVEGDDAARRLAEKLEHGRQTCGEPLPALRHDANVGRQPCGDLLGVVGRTDGRDADADSAGERDAVFDERPVQLDDERGRVHRAEAGLDVTGTRRLGHDRQHTVVIGVRQSVAVGTRLTRDSAGPVGELVYRPAKTAFE